MYNPGLSCCVLVDGHLLMHVSQAVLQAAKAWVRMWWCQKIWIVKGAPAGA